MKKIIYILFIALPLIWSACEVLEEEPIGILAPEAYFGSKADGLSVVMGIYAGMAHYNDYGNDMQMVIGARDDMQKIFWQDRFTHDEMYRVTAVDLKAENMWRQIYSQIKTANCAIEGIAKIPDDKITSTDKNALIAEATVHRAFNYFRLVRMYGDVPYIEDFVTEPGKLKNVTRDPVDEIYSHIIDDLEANKDFLPDSYDVGGSPVRSRISKGTAYTILADVYLTRENWAKAAENAEYIIQNAGNFNYELLTDFADLYQFYEGNDNKEFVWSVDFSDTDGGYPYGRDQFAELTSPPPPCDYNGWGTNYASERTYLSFDTLDYRTKITFITEAPFSGVMLPYPEWTPNASPAIGKWFRSFIGTDRQNNCWETNMNPPVYRYAEVLLIAAEALNEANGGPTQASYDYINQIRDRARNYDGEVDNSTIPVDIAAGLSQAEFRDVVIEERRIELAFEFKRWWDITRLDLIAEGVFGPDGTDPLPVKITMDYELLPVPQSEIDVNQNLTQNPGY